MSLPPRHESRHSLRVDVSGHTVKLQGVLEEMDVKAWLYPFLIDVHQAAVDSRMPEVIIDIRQLTYANAGLLRSMVAYLRLLHEDKKAPYSLRLLADPVNRWQKYGVPALKHFGADRIVVR